VKLTQPSCEEAETEVHIFMKCTETDRQTDGENKFTNSGRGAHRKLATLAKLVYYD
jgi:hypothetical protein